jgi:elongation factor 2
MARKEVVAQDVGKLMSNRDHIRNMGIVAHVDHGKTTLSDSLVAVAGLISRDLAGEQRVLDYDPQEQARGITIKAANISLGFEYEGEDYMINMIDTPGHVDFSGHVTRAMRAVDGVILVVDSVEQIMPQTETVVRQALKEKVKIVLFINKIDRLINELKLDSVGMQERFLKIIAGVNKLINTYAPEEMREDWRIAVDKGNVAFGTGFNKWAISQAIMKKNQFAFKDLYELCSKGDHATLRQKAPIEEVILEMVVKHLPSPIEAQKYRIPVIWHGDKDSVYGKAMINCDPSGPVTFMITAIAMDEHAGEVAVGRLYSGTVRKGTELYLASRYKTEKLQGVSIYMGPDRVLVDEASAGNIVALVGLKDIFAGETASEGQMDTAFEAIKHHSEPVVTKSVEAKNPRDLVKLIEVLQKLGKEDPTLRVEINHETGEHLISGMGELHLEIIEYKISKERGVDITTSPPIVVYHETIVAEGPELEGKSPNKHNKFKIYVEPMEEGVQKAFNDGTIGEHTKGKELIEKLIAAGLNRDEAKKILAYHRDNLFIDATKGVQYLQDIKELIVQAFEEAVDQGPLAKEKVVGVKVILTDATIHVDPAHRGPAQLFPAIKRPIYASMLGGKCVLFEPKQKLFVNSPSDYMSGIINTIQGRRGQVLEIQQEGEAVSVVAKVPVSAMFGFASDIRGATQGRAAWYYEYAGYEKLPESLQAPTIAAIRKRKGEPEVAPTAKDFVD